MKRVERRGRPERSKTSYRNEIQFRKRRERELEENITELHDIVSEQSEALWDYRFPTIKQRIKYLLKGELWT